MHERMRDEDHERRPLLKGRRKCLSRASLPRASESPRPRDERLASEDALAILHGHLGHRLEVIAQARQISFQDNDKGAFGKIVEALLGVRGNSRQGSDLLDAEIKTSSWKRLKKDGLWVPAQTMAITMIDREHVMAHPFEESRLYEKMRRTLNVCRSTETGCLLAAFVHDLDADREAMRIITSDYEDQRECLRRGEKLSGSMGALIQPRTKGQGHGSTSRAFYARRQHLQRITDTNSFVC